ncbi:hypothetical protein K458DRAFT_407552 [Lentithecium fluviatile CBS 122367]|uniref:Uncharacterized protein n=1 Tax=Lentithecium fluviatile CBS 122367 TaxID=1168545 RepID=A0A6G1IP14_9PLEO|nr:hypothetical protein K458DRAFT_407552 [Lentithecium fluviatile CBS 122367]
MVKDAVDTPIPPKTLGNSAEVDMQDILTQATDNFNLVNKRMSTREVNIKSNVNGDESFNLAAKDVSNVNGDETFNFAASNVSNEEIALAGLVPKAQAVKRLQKQERTAAKRAHDQLTRLSTIAATYAKDGRAAQAPVKRAKKEKVVLGITPSKASKPHKPKEKTRDKTILRELDIDNSSD